MKFFQTFSCLLLGLVFTFSAAGQSLGMAEGPNQISFEKSAAGLIFTNIQINGEEVVAMIDFGDQHILQLSSSLVQRLGLPVKSAGYQVSDLHGQSWEVLQGRVEEMLVGSWTRWNEGFTMQKGEMEAVSAQIGTQFDAVLGWGYFKSYFAAIDYARAEITLTTQTPAGTEVAFQLPFDRSANQLIVTGSQAGKSIRLMIDTGSPVSVVDSREGEATAPVDFSCTLAGTPVQLSAYPQDLSLLADLGVVAILGGDFLAQWIVTIDPHASLLYFSRPTE